MKKFALLSFITVAIVFASVTESFTKKAQPPTAKTGAPSESTCGSTATGCHNTAPNSFTGTLTVDFGQTSYSPGQTLTVTVTTSESGMTRFGFEGTMLDGSNAKAGDFAIINTATTSLQNSGNKQYIGHKAAGTTNSWTFEWTAPGGVGPVTFYLSSICGNANNSASGDHCYLATQVLDFLPNGVTEVKGVTDFLTIENSIASTISLQYLSSANTNTVIRLIDLNGRTINNLVSGVQSPGTHSLTFTKPTVTGLYFIEYIGGNNREVKKMMVL